MQNTLGLRRMLRNGHLRFSLLPRAEFPLPRRVWYFGPVWSPIGLGIVGRGLIRTRCVLIRSDGLRRMRSNYYRVCRRFCLLRPAGYPRARRMRYFSPVRRSIRPDVVGRGRVRTRRTGMRGLFWHPMFNAGAGLLARWQCRCWMLIRWKWCCSRGGRGRYYMGWPPRSGGGACCQLPDQRCAGAGRRPIFGVELTRQRIVQGRRRGRSPGCDHRTMGQLYRRPVGRSRLGSADKTLPHRSQRGRRHDVRLRQLLGIHRPQRRMYRLAPDKSCG